MNRISLILILTSIAFFSCNTRNDKGFKEAENGLIYKFHEKHPENKQAQKGDVLILDMIYEKEDGTVLFNSSDNDRAYMKILKAPAHTGGALMDALAMMHVKDSASFKINTFEFYRFTEKHDNIPDNIEEDDKLTFHIKLNKILKKDEFGKQIDKAYHISREKEQELLDNYLELSNTEVEPDSTGLYVVHLKEGSGEEPEPGDVVTVHYTGKLISGKPFETSLDKKPLTFKIGSGNVIKGWERGMQQVKEGGKARLIIPSELAYGKQGKEDILPYSTLIFEIELIDVKKN